MTKIKKNALPGKYTTYWYDLRCSDAGDLGATLDRLSGSRVAMRWLEEFLIRVVLALMIVGNRALFYPLAKICGGYKRFEPQPDSVLVTCCTNGLGHIHQMERVLSVLEQEGLRFPIIALAKLSKVPAYKLDALKRRFPSATFYDLDFEVDYESGESFRGTRIIWNAMKTGVRRGIPLVRKVSRLLREHRPEVCLSFWEPSVSQLIDVLNCPTRVVALSSQGQAYRDATSPQRDGLLVRGLMLLNLGRHGRLVPLSVLPMEGALPQIVHVPPSHPAEDYYVAYSTAPNVLAPIRRDLGGQNAARVLLFVKDRRHGKTLAWYRHKYRETPNVEVRPVAAEFAELLARSRGLIASSSRGVVTQALALGKPVYLFCPKGHREQEYNLAFYVRNFEGVSCPNRTRYRRLLRLPQSSRGVLPADWSGRLQTLGEWAKGIPNLDLVRQTVQLNAWLGQTDGRIRSLLRHRLFPPEVPDEQTASGSRAHAPEASRLIQRWSGKEGMPGPWWRGLSTREAPAEMIGADKWYERAGGTLREDVEEEEDDDEDEDEEEEGLAQEVNA